MFSEIVDLVVKRSARPDRKSDIQSYVNQTIRECQVLAYFVRDMTEDTLTASSTPYLWDRPKRLRLLRTVRYPGDVYPKYAPPGKVQLRYDHYYYGGPTYFAFAGMSAGDEIDIAYYSYSKRFNYYDVGARPAIYDYETETWTYLSGGSYVSDLGSEALNEAAQELVSHWLMIDWFDLIVEGALAKLFKNVDDDRASASYALYKQLQKDLKQGEVFESLGV